MAEWQSTPLPAFRTTDQFRIIAKATMATKD
jgi:hypothetical protein